MGWSVGRDNNWGRDIGYGVPAICDHPCCGAKIHRGLSYVCGGEPYGGDAGCGLYFCDAHLCESQAASQLCNFCLSGSDPPGPTPDVPEWINHKLTDESWSGWRKMNKQWVMRTKKHSADGHGRAVVRAEEKDAARWRAMRHCSTD